jgi:membrane protease YdiL (CAAX protease family)
MTFLAVVPSAVIAVRGFTDPTDIDLDVEVVELVASLLAALGPAVMALYLLWRDDRLEEAGFGRRSAGFIAGYGALGWVCCFIGILTVGIMLSILLLATGGDVESSSEPSYDVTAGTVIAGIAVALTAGIGEEIVFRAYAITRMAEAGYSSRAAMWAPWAVFTAVHLYQGPLALLIVGTVGAVLTWLYVWKRSVWPVMVTHFLYDATILLLVITA